MEETNNIINKEPEIELSIEEQVELEQSYKGKRVIDYSEKGSTGNYFSGGYESYEYQTELQGNKKFEEYDKMKRGSAMARATMKAIVLPLMGARWLLKPGGTSSVDKFQADFVHKNLFQCMSSSWSKTIYQILQNVAYGFYPFEKVFVRSKNWSKWGFGGDWIVLKKLAPRHPITIEKVHFDDEGGVFGLEQVAYFNKKETTEYKTVFLPIRKLLIFSYDQEGDNIEGISLFRTGYGHWRSIKILYNIGMIGAERMALGFPVFEYPENYWDISDAARKDISNMFDNILKNFRAHQYAGAKIPPKAKLHMVKGEFDIEAIDKLVSHHEMKIAQCALAQFLKTGEARVGSHNLFTGQSDFFLNSLKALGQDTCDTVNDYLIPEILTNNFNEIDNLPKLYLKDIGIRDLREFAEITQVLTRSNLLVPDKAGNLEDELRKVFDYPERTKAQKELSLQAEEIVQTQLDDMLKSGVSPMFQQPLTGNFNPDSNSGYNSGGYGGNNNFNSGGYNSNSYGNSPVYGNQGGV